VRGVVGTLSIHREDDLRLQFKNIQKGSRDVIDQIFPSLPFSAHLLRTSSALTSRPYMEVAQWKTREPVGFESDSTASWSTFRPKRVTHFVMAMWLCTERSVGARLVRVKSLHTSNVMQKYSERRMFNVPPEPYGTRDG
jgi:hypothetical protein